MNAKALAMLALADRGIAQKTDPNAGLDCRAMITDCLPYFRQRLDAEMRQKAIYEAQAQDENLTERERLEARGMLEALEITSAEISAIEQGKDSTFPYIDLTEFSPFTSVYCLRLIGAPPPPDSPYFNRESVQRFLPHWNDTVWLIEDVAVNRLYRNWVKLGRRYPANA